MKTGNLDVIAMGRFATSSILRWMQMAQDRPVWRTSGEPYVQQ